MAKSVCTHSARLVDSRATASLSAQGQQSERGIADRLAHLDPGEGAPLAAFS